MPHATDTLEQPSSPPSSSERLRAFFRIAELWGLTTDQQIVLLGSPSRSTFFKWKKDGGEMSQDTEERISHLVSIYKSLQIIIPEPVNSDTWLKRPNRFFDGRTALDKMLDGKLTDIYAVRSYVDAQRGG